MAASTISNQLLEVTLHLRSDGATPLADVTVSGNLQLSDEDVILINQGVPFALHANIEAVDTGLEGGVRGVFLTYPPQVISSANGPVDATVPFSFAEQVAMAALNEDFQGLDELRANISLLDDDGALKTAITKTGIVQHEFSS